MVTQTVRRAWLKYRTPRGKEDLVDGLLDL